MKKTKPFHTFFIFKDVFVENSVPIYGHLYLVVYASVIQNQ